MFLNTKRGSLGYLKCNCPTNKDYRSLLGVCEEFWVDVESILEETEKVFLQERTMFVVNLTVFACPTQDVGRCPRDDSVGSESLIRDGERRMIKALRRLQCFVRLGMILRSGRVHNAWAWKEPDAGCSAEIKCIRSERAESSKKLSSAIYTYKLFRADR